MQSGLTGVDREVKRLEAFFDYFVETKESARLVNEAPVMAPKGFARFSHIVREGYIRALERSMARGEIEKIDSRRLSDIADFLIALRNGFSQLILASAIRNKRVPQHFLDSYRKFVGRALFRDYEEAP